MRETPPLISLRSYIFSSSTTRDSTLSQNIKFEAKTEKHLFFIERLLNFALVKVSC